MDDCIYANTQPMRITFPCVAKEMEGLLIDKNLKKLSQSDANSRSVILRSKHFTQHDFGIRAHRW